MEQATCGRDGLVLKKTDAAWPQNQISPYYSIGLLSSVNRVPAQMCYSGKCETQGISMCRYPYYPSSMSRPYFAPVPVCGITRYFYTV